MRTRIAMATFVMGLAMTASTRAAEEEIKLSEVPKVILDAVKVRFAGAELTGAARETDDDNKTVYEVSLKLKGQTIDSTWTPEGALQVIESKIDPKDVPEAVRKTIDGKYPKATWKIAEEVVAVENGKEKLDFYEVLLVTADEKKLEVKVSPDGTIQAEEAK